MSATADPGVPAIILIDWHDAKNCPGKGQPQRHFDRASDTLKYSFFLEKPFSKV